MRITASPYGKLPVRRTRSNVHVCTTCRLNCTSVAHEPPPFLRNDVSFQRLDSERPCQLEQFHLRIFAFPRGDRRARGRAVISRAVAVRLTSSSFTNRRCTWTHCLSLSPWGTSGTPFPRMHLYSLHPWEAFPPTWSWTVLQDLKRSRNPRLPSKPRWLLKSQDEPCPARKDLVVSPLPDVSSRIQGMLATLRISA